MIKYKILVVFCLVLSNIKGQNLIKNGGFENCQNGACSDISSFGCCSNGNAGTATPYHALNTNGNTVPTATLGLGSGLESFTQYHRSLLLLSVSKLWAL